jgi:hypothetical protein
VCVHTALRCGDVQVSRGALRRREPRGSRRTQASGIRLGSPRRTPRPRRTRCSERTLSSTMTRIWRERQEGKGRGDTVRLQTRGVLRGVRNASRGTRSTIRRVITGGSLREKRDEPPPAAGCNKPAPHAWSKPPGWCETTQAEQDRTWRCPAEAERPRAREGSWTGSGSGRARAGRRGGGKRTNPTRGRGATPGSERELRRRIKLQEACTVGHSTVRSPAGKGRPRRSAR